MHAENITASKASATAASVPVRTLSTASLLSPCPGLESGTPWKVSLPAPLLPGYSGEPAFSFERLFQRGGVREDSVDLGLLSLRASLAFCLLLEHSPVPWHLSGV